MTTVAQSAYYDGGFLVIEAVLTGGAGGGAVTAEEIIIPREAGKKRMLYTLESIAGAGTLTPDAHTITLTDKQAGPVLLAVAASVSGKAFIDVTTDLESYHPVNGNLLMTVQDIGIGHQSTFRFIFT